MAGLRMCPIWPLHIIVMYLLVLAPMWLFSCAALNYAGEKLPVYFDPVGRYEVFIDTSEQVNIFMNTSTCQQDRNDFQLMTSEDSADIAKVDKSVVINNYNGSLCWGTFNVTGVNLGTITVKARDDKGSESDPYTIAVIREKGVIDDVFVASVATLVSIIYINFGCALDLDVLKATFKRPIGPAIGLACQFVLMPLISYGLGLWIFPESPEMRLGMFYTGLSPAGGASNIWSVALEANVNLSVTMTTISTIAAFGMFPFWLFTLGDRIFVNADMSTPYQKVGEYLFCLIVPLGFGIFSQKYLPRFSRLMVRILKPFSVFLILFIIIFACVANTYIFNLFTWKIALAGLGLPWLGYLGGFLAALALKQPMKDVLAIAVETGVQNTGIAIFMLKFSLGNPAGDITTVIPVAVSVMTPIPLFLLFCYIKIRNRNQSKAQISKEGMLEIDDTESDLGKKEPNGNGQYIRQP